MKKNGLMELVMSLFVATYANAAEATANTAETNLTDSLREVVVTGTRMADDVRYLPLTVRSIDRSQIDLSFQHSLMPLVVEQTPGLFLTSRGLMGYGVSTGAAGAMTIRGIGGQPTTEVMVLVDGHPQYAGLFGHTIADAYQSMIAERVELVSGPASVLYGAHAMGGVMNIITRKAVADGCSSKLRLQGGSYGTADAEYTGLIKKGGFNNVFGVSASHSDGHRHNMPFEQYTFFDKMKFALGNRWSVDANFDYTQFLAQNPGTTASPMHSNKMDICRGMASVSLNNDYGWASGSLSFYDSWGNHRIDDGYATGGAPKQKFFAMSDQNYGVNWFETFKLLRGNHTTIGFDYEHEQGSVWDQPKNGGDLVYTYPKLRTDNVAAYLDIRQTLFDVLTFDVAGRYDYHSKAGANLVPQLGLSLQASNSATLKLTASKGFRTPVLRELYMYKPANPDLKVEEMNNYELSWRHFIGEFSYTLNVFYADVENLIQTQMVRDPNGSTRPMNQNTGAMHNFGAEMTAALKINSAWSANANYSYLHTSRQIVLAPRHKLYGGLSYSKGRFGANVGAQWIGHLITEVGNPDAVENYVLVNAKLNYKATSWLKMFATGDNLLCQKYETYRGYPMPRATFMGGVELTF